MRIITRTLAILGLLALCQSFAPAAQSQANTNVFAVGNQAKTKEAIDIKPNLPAFFNNRTRAEILAMRTKEIQKYPMLYRGEYTPYNPIWGAIEDHKPWWGTAGATVFDSGNRSMLGPSEESRFVMNPYMLVGANPGSTGIWNPGVFTDKEINNPAFPFFWQPSLIHIEPARLLEIVHYNITAYQDAIQKTNMLKGPTYIRRFSLVAYNARDLGYSYIYFNPEKSINVLNDNPTHDAVFIKQMIHCGGTCGCTTTCCNNMSPFIEEIDRLRFTKLPARAVVYLWKEAPASIEKSPDMTVLIEFR